MFWDKISPLYDLFENIYNGKVYTGTGKKVAEFIVQETDKFILLQRDTKLMQDNSVSRKAVAKAFNDLMKEQKI